MEKKLRVAVLIDAWFPFYGGGQVHVKELTKRMSRKCDFTIYHADSEALFDRILWTTRVIPKVIQEYQKKPFDLIHAHAYIAGLPGNILSKILRIPVIYTVHGCNTLDLTKMKKEKKEIDVPTPTWKFLLEKWLLTRIRYDHQISVTKHFLKYQNLNQNISIIPNGVDTRDFDRIEAKKRKHFTVIFVGREDPVKGIVYLEKATERVKSKLPGIRLAKITKGIVTGEKLIRAYKSSHLFVLPSLSEGHPLTLLEAWAAKLPVIVTSVGDNPKMVINGKNGYLIPPADENAIANAIIEAYNNPNLERLGKEGYNLVKNNYSWEKAAEATLRVYKEVIHGA